MGKAIIITGEMVERLQQRLNHLDKLSVKYWARSEEAEKAGDLETAKRYERKSNVMDEKYMAVLDALSVFGFNWSTTLQDDGTDKILLFVP